MTCWAFFGLNLLNFVTASTFHSPECDEEGHYYFFELHCCEPRSTGTNLMPASAFISHFSAPSERDQRRPWFSTMSPDIPSSRPSVSQNPLTPTSLWIGLFHSDLNHKSNPLQSMYFSTYRFIGVNRTWEHEAKKGCCVAWSGTLGRSEQECREPPWAYRGDV